MLLKGHVCKSFLKFQIISLVFKFFSGAATILTLLFLKISDRTNKSAYYSYLNWPVDKIVTSLVFGTWFNFQIGRIRRYFSLPTFHFRKKVQAAAVQTAQ